MKQKTNIDDWMAEDNGGWAYFVHIRPTGDHKGANVAVDHWTFFDALMDLDPKWVYVDWKLQEVSL